MEITHFYKGFGITYYSITGNTEIYTEFGSIIVFKRKGQFKGKELAHEFIDLYLQ